MKANPDFLTNVDLTRGVQTRTLTAENSSDMCLEVMLYEYGYLSITNLRKKPDELYTLHFPSLEAQIALFTDLISGADLEDGVVGDALSHMKQSLRHQVPMDSTPFTPFVQAMDTIISRIPINTTMNPMFYRLAMFGALRFCGFGPKFGNTMLDGDIMYCDDWLPDTRLILAIDFKHNIYAKSYWHTEIKNSVESFCRIRQPAKIKALAVMIMCDGGKDNNPVRDWYAQYFTRNENKRIVVLDEYNPPANMERK